MIKAKAIFSLYPNIVNVIDDEIAYDADGNQVQYDKDAVQAYINANAYIAKRQPNYPSIGDQLDMLWHAIDTNSLNKTSDFYTAIKAVKDAYPKNGT